MKEINNNDLVMVGNIQYFFEKSIYVINKYNYNASDYSLVVIDLDNFRVINKKYGFDKGDEVLYFIENLLSNELREYEIMTRVDSDIFYMLLHKNKDNKELSVRLKSIVEKIKGYDGVSLRPSIFVHNIEEREEIQVVGLNIYMTRKKIKLEKSKTVFYCDNNETKKIVDSKKLLEDFKEAIKNKDFKVYYQVKQDLQKGKPLGAEALVRWNHKTRGIIPPLEFIELFEESGDIVALDLYVFERVCENTEQWIKEYGNRIKQFKISINISRRTLLEDNIVDKLVEIAKKYKLSTRNMEIEVTETFFSSDVEKIINVLSYMRQRGFRISVDDFGSGYSAFNILKELKVDVLKIDREFLNADKVDSKTKNILNSIVGLGKKLKLEVTAEGVETKEQSNYLRKIGCDYAQGFYYSRPVPVEEFEENTLKEFVLDV